MKISEIITGWYKKNRRSLPWRATRDPYRIWLSEVILQQTRISQGTAYYQAFVGRFPDINALAGASEQEVIKLWQGLGYYSRARNLHAAARQVVGDLDGMFPASRDELLNLKGIGPYTAAAIASIAYNEPVAAVDGNVARVISRLFAIDTPVNTPKGEKEISGMAETLLDRDDPGEHNQAMMEFGALQCVPVNPDCHGCPLNSLCRAFAEDRVAELPVKLKKAKIKKRYFTYMVISHQKHTYIERRTSDDIWKELYQFPLTEHDTLPKEEEIPGIVEARIGALPEMLFGGTPHELGKPRFSIYTHEQDRPQYSNEPHDQGKPRFSIHHISEPVKHQLTHQLITARFVHVEITEKGFRAPVGWERVPPEKVGEYPLPRLIDRYLEMEDGAPG